MGPGGQWSAISLLHCCAAPPQPASMILPPPQPAPDPASALRPCDATIASAAQLLAPHDAPWAVGGVPGGRAGLGVVLQACPPAEQRHVLLAAAAHALDVALANSSSWAECQVAPLWDICSGITSICHECAALCGQTIFLSMRACNHAK